MTGGASELGREICMKLAKEGCNLAVVDSDINGAKLTCHAAEKLGIEALPYEVSFYNSIFVDFKHFFLIFVHLIG